MPETQASQQLGELISRIAKLPSENLDPPQFFANFLQLTVAATGSQGGAIWLTQTGQAPQCYCHIELESTGIHDSEGQKQLIVEAIGRTVSEEKPLVIPVPDSQAPELASGPANQCPYPFIFKPLRAAHQVAMVLQLIGRPQLKAEEFQVVVGLLGQIAEAAETYLAHRRAAVLEDDRKVLAQLLQYSEGIHDSLDPQKVIYQLANLGRDAIGCERVAVWIDPQVKRELRAVSGIDKPDKRAVLIRAVERLSRYCLSIKKPIVAAREQMAELPDDEELTELLKDYFNVSQLNQVYLQPMQAGDRQIGVIVAEGFDEKVGTNLAGVISTVAKHGGVALQNALQMDAVPLVRPFAKLQQVKSDPSKRRRWLVTTGAILTLLLVAALMPWTIRINCACELTPQQTRRVVAPMDGLQVQRFLRTSGEVKAGEVIAQLDEGELQANLTSLDGEFRGESANRSRLSGPVDIELSESRLQQIQGQIALLKRQISKCQVRSPIAGWITTPEKELKQLENTTVKMGEQLCEIADVDHWIISIDVPQEEVGWVLRGLAENETAQVRFFLKAYPKQKFTAEVISADQIGQMPRLDADGNQYEVRLEISDTEFTEEIVAGLRSGLLGRAKIDTCKRPVAYVLLRKVIRFFRVTFF